MKNQNGGASKLKWLLVAAVSLAPMLAQAHPFHGESNSFTSGLGHPIHGWDHLLAMVAVGLWAAQLGGRAIWMVPAAFLGLMTVGNALGFAGIHLPLVEAGIMASVLVLGLLIATATRLPLAISMIGVGVFALFHGFAHGAEMPGGASAMSYEVGFTLTTALLHLCGICLGLLAQKKVAVPAIRYAGAAIAVTGLCLWVF